MFLTCNDSSIYVTRHWWYETVGWSDTQTDCYYSILLALKNPLFNAPLRNFGTFWVNLKLNNYKSLLCAFKKSLVLSKWHNFIGWMRRWRSWLKRSQCGIFQLRAFGKNWGICALKKLTAACQMLCPSAFLHWIILLIPFEIISIIYILNESRTTAQR